MVWRIWIILDLLYVGGMGGVAYEKYLRLEGTATGLASTSGTLTITQPAR